MKLDKVGAFFAIMGALAVMLTIGLIVYRLDKGILETAVMLLVGGVVLALVVGAASLPIRAWRKTDNPPERHIVQKHTHTITEGRTVDPPKIYTMPQAQQGGGWDGVYPDMLRAAFIAGRRGLPGGQVEQIEPDEADIVDLTAEWNGEIKG